MKQFDTHALIDWYHQSKRSLPFRETNDPYAIWISEIMAQQTQIATMIPYYQKWMKSFPDVFSLASASEESVLKHWEGLGYYTRARNLQKAAKVIVNDLEGVFPANKTELLKLPGIGDYTASAIASIAYGQHEIAIDGNVIRVLSRFLASDVDYSKEKEKQGLRDFLKNASSDVEPGDFTQALMELGALVCTPKAYRCDQCPFRDNCLARSNNQVDQYPIKKATKESPIEHYQCFICIADNQILLDLNPQDTLMKGLIRLPQIPKEETSPFSKNDFQFTITHVFSHKKWSVDVYISTDIKINKKEWKFIPLQEVHALPFIGVHNKIIEKLNLF